MPVAQGLAGQAAPQAELKAVQWAEHCLLPIGSTCLGVFAVNVELSLGVCTIARIYIAHVSCNVELAATDYMPLTGTSI